MAITYDAASQTSATFTSTTSWTHAGGTPRGVIVFVAQQGADPGVVDEVSGVTYGGVSMTKITGTYDSITVPIIHASGEDNACYAFFLGSGLSGKTGNQTVEVTCSGTAGVKQAYCYTVAAGADTETVDIAAIEDAATLTNPSVTIQLGGNNCFVAQAAFSGRPDTDQVTPFTNWTQDFTAADYGASTAWSHRYTIIGSSDVTCGYTSNADECSLIAVAVKESASATSINIPVGATTLTTYAPSLDLTFSGGISIPVGSTQFTTYDHVVSVVSGPVSIPVGVGTIQATTYDLSLGTSGNKSFDIGVGSATLTANLVSLGIAVSVDTAFDPAEADPGDGALGVTGYAPTSNQSFNISVTVGAGTLTGFAPTPNVFTGTDTAIPIGSGSISVTAYAESLATTYLVGVGATTLTGEAPTVSTPADQNYNLPIGPGTLSLVGYISTALVEETSKVIPIPRGSLGFSRHPILFGSSPAAGGTRQRRKCIGMLRR